MKNLMKYLSAVLIACIAFFNAMGQQPVSYNLYTLNPVLLNPAATGYDGCLNAFLNNHNQWTDVPNPPTQFTFGVQGKITNSAGLGALIVNDNRSYVKYLTANILYSYKVKFSDVSSLSFGLSAGVANNSLNTNTLQVKDMNDPLLQTFNNTRFDAGFGALYHMDKLKIGASIPHFFDNSGAFSNQFNLSASYDFKNAEKSFRFTPLLMARNYNVAGLVYDAHLMAFWNEKFGLQAGYRTDKSIIAGLGLNLGKFQLAYAYQYHIGTYYSAYSANGTQEIQLAFKLCKDASKAPKADNTDPDAGIAKVHFVVKDNNGNAAKGAQVKISKDGNVIYSGSPDANGNPPVRLEPGKYKVETSGNGLKPQVAEIEIPGSAKGKEINQPVTLMSEPKDEKAIAMIELLDDKDKVPADAKVVIKDANGKVVYEGVADKNGKVPAKLDPGAYTVELSGNGYLPAQYKLTIPAEGKGQEMKVPLKIKSDPLGNQVGANFTVKNPAGKALPNTKVSLLKGGVLVYSGVTDANGNLSVKLDPGSYETNLEGDGYQSAKYKIELPAEGKGQNMDIPLSMKVDPSQQKVDAMVELLDDKTGAPLNGTITLSQNGVQVYSASTDPSGINKLSLKPGIYKMEVEAKGYLPIVEELNLGNGKANYKIKAMKVEKGAVFKFKSINFETASDQLTPESFKTLDLVAKTFLEYPNIIAEVSGHTDNVGDAKANLTLSDKRAKAVVEYLKTKGVNSNQMRSVGFGQTKPIATNDTPEGRLQNRRVQFEVISF